MRRFCTLSVLIASSLLVPTRPSPAAPLPPGGTFVDDDFSIHEGYIEALAEAGVTAGCGSAVYCPRAPVTRGQMAAFLSTALNLPPTSSAPFSDAGGIFEDAINRLAAAGITSGCGNGRFCPSDPVTRGQMAAFLYNGFAGTLTPGTPIDFTDTVGSIFRPAIEWLSAVGVTAGCNPPANDHFCPTNVVTREQMATFLARSLQIAANNPPDRPLPPAGNPTGTYPVPAEAWVENTSSPDVVIGDGGPASCTSEAVVAAVKSGGVITFDCGPDPVVIDMDATAFVHNWRNGVVGVRNEKTVIDGGGRVTLSGRGERQIIHQNTCTQALGWTTSHCQDQDHPRLVIQNLTFVDADGTGAEDGGGALFVRGGQLKVVNSRFFRNQCDETGPDVGGGAIRTILMYSGAPVYVVNSTFGGSSSLSNQCSNGGAVSGLWASITVINSYFAYNETTGWGANPQRSGTPGGGNGGALYGDGNPFHFRVLGTRMEHNVANEGGGAIFFVSNNRTGTLTLTDSSLSANPSLGFETVPGIFYLGNGPIRISNSTIE